jgi:hypothetical protein
MDSYLDLTALSGVCLTLQHKNNKFYQLVMAGFGDKDDYRGDTKCLDLPGTATLEEALNFSLRENTKWWDCFDMATVIFVLDDNLLDPLLNVLSKYNEKIILFRSFFGMSPDRFTSVLLPNAFIVTRENAIEFAEAVTHHLTYDLIEPGILEPWLKHIQGMINITCCSS